MADKVVTPAAGDAANMGGNPDPTLVSGQDPDSLFGISISYDTGGQGTAGASGQPDADPTNEPGQYPSKEPISGVTLSDTGSPGSMGAGDLNDNPAGQSFTITDPNYTAGRPGGGSGNVFITAPVQVGGPKDSTTAPGQYGGSNPMPSMAQPADTGAGKGRVMRGGWMNGDRG